MAGNLSWHLRLPERLYDQLVPLAERDGRTPANLARHLLERAAGDFHEHNRAAERRDGRQRKG